MSIECLVEERSDPPVLVVMLGVEAMTEANEEFGRSFDSTHLDGS
ncbi:hypothetical protein ACFLT5_03265 [Chloroflexota bacterium]